MANKVNRYSEDVSDIESSRKKSSGGPNGSTQFECRWAGMSLEDCSLLRHASLFPAREVMREYF